MRPKGVDDAQRVNIPAPDVKVEPLREVFQGGSPCKLGVPAGVKLVGRGRFVSEVHGERLEKSAVVTTRSPVLKLTQVGEESILRRSRELRLRN